MKPNNLYYRDIAEIVVGDEFPKFYSSMYYMRKIAEELTGSTYSGRKSSNKYLKDWHTAETGNTPDTHKYNLWYLRRIARKYDPEFDMDSNENQCLEVIAENIDAHTSLKLVLTTQSPAIYNDMYINVILLDENRQPIEDAGVTISDGDEFEETDVTNSEGKFTHPMLYAPQTLGEVQITATYGEYTATATLNVRKLVSSITIGVDSPVVTVDGTATISGTYYEDNVPAHGVIVKIYKDDVYIGYTQISSSDGTYSYSITPTEVGTFTYKAVVEEDEIMTGCESDEVSIVVNKHLSTLTIDTPTIIYSDAFDVTGTLLKSGSALANAPVILTWSDGDGHSGTATENTDSNGKVTFSRSEPTSITQYTFQLSYVGTTNILGSESSEINVNVDKETSVLNITSPQTGASVSQADTITVTGTLKDNDDEVMSGKTVYAKLGNTTLETFTVDSNGDISGTISASDLNVDSNSIEFGFTATTEYTGSTQTVTVNKGLTYTKLEVEATNPILSYTDSESTDMTAQLLDNSDNPVALSGVTIYFKDGATTLGSAQTDATGKATLLNAYTSQGRGDVQITVDDGSLVTENFPICDAWKYDPTNYTSTRSNLNISLPSGNFEITAKINPTSRNSSYAQITYGTDSNNRVYFGQGTENGRCGLYAKSGGSTVINQTMSNAIPLNTYSEIKYSYVDGVHTLKVGNETVTGSNSTISRTKIYEIYCTNNNFKELLIKPL